MTEEQFKSLTTMMHDIAYSALKTYDLSHSPRVNQSERLEAARQASINSGKAIAKARALLVEQPAKEIKNDPMLCPALYDNNAICLCGLHKRVDGKPKNRIMQLHHKPNDESAVHYHITEYTGVAGQSEYVNKLPCSKCNWGHSK